MVNWKVATLVSIAVSAISSSVENSIITETIGPQEIGTTNISGSIVYSVNYCTVVRSTGCYLSLSMGGSAPNLASETEGDEYGHTPSMSQTVQAHTTSLISVSAPNTSAGPSATTHSISTSFTYSSTSLPTGGANGLIARGGRIVGAAAAIAYII